MDVARPNLLRRPRVWVIGTCVALVVVVAGLALASAVQRVREAANRSVDM